MKLILVLIPIILLLIFLAHDLLKMPGNFPVVKVNFTGEVLIGIISDTHVPTRASSLPKEIKEIFRNVSLIIHAGDWVDLSVVKELELIAPVIAVHGNMDPPELRERFPNRICIEVFNWRIGVMHNSFLPIEWKLRRIAKENDLNILIFGHTHRPFLKKGEPLLLNPGSPTNAFFANPSVALLRINNESYKVKIIEIIQ
jgi:hypothetical protein